MTRGNTRRVFAVASVATTPENNERLQIESPGKEKGHMFISKATLPVTARGRGTATPTASIRENGQLSLNKPVVEKIGFNGAKNRQMLIDWEDKDRSITLFIYGDKLPKDHKEDEYYTLMNSEKVGGAYAGLAGLWKQLGYDYKESGNQNFPASIIEGKGVVKVSFNVPKGSLERHEVTPRKKKAVAASAGANGSTAATTSAGELEDVD